MTTRPLAPVFAALALAAVVVGCGAGASTTDQAAVPADAVEALATGTVAPAPADQGPDPSTTTDPGSDPPEPTHEELTEADPGDGDGTGSTTTTDDPGSEEDDSSSTTSTTTHKPLYVSQKGEPTGPGVPAIPTYSQTADEVEYFACVTFRESSNNPTVINVSSGAAGLFQFLQSTWDLVARRIGRYDLVGVNPALASVATQRYMAHVLFVWQGASPWVSDGCQLPHHGTTTTTTATVRTTSTTTAPTSTSTTSTRPAPSPPG